MKSERGITLVSLVVYIIIATIVIGTMALVSTFFFNNMNGIKNQEKYAPEFNKFAMFFIEDVKTNAEATVTTQTVTFERGDIYQYKSDEKKIYRNDKVIAKEVEDVQFTLERILVGSKQKNIIRVKMIMGKKQEFNKEVEFVLRYW